MNNRYLFSFNNMLVCVYIWETKKCTEVILTWHQVSLFAYWLWSCVVTVLISVTGYWSLLWSSVIILFETRTVTFACKILPTYGLGISRTALNRAPPPFLSPPVISSEGPQTTRSHHNLSRVRDPHNLALWIPALYSETHCPHPLIWLVLPPASKVNEDTRIW